MGQRRWATSSGEGVVGKEVTNVKGSMVCGDEMVNVGVLG